MKSSSVCFLKICILVSFVTIILGSPSVQAQSAAANSWGWKEIAVGVTHSLGIKNDGTVWQWGDTTTYRGSAGSETNLSALIPEKAPGLTDIVQVAGGQVHSLALERDGTVWTWGGNHSGQLGDGTTVSRTTPQKVSGLTDVVSIEADWTRSYAVKKDGTVWGWGEFTDTPAQLIGFENIVYISAGYGSFMALMSDGTVWYLSDKATQVAGVKDIVQIAVGAEYTYGLKTDGTVWFWGSNGDTFSRINGVSTANASDPQSLQGVTDVVSVQASAGGPLLLKKDGTVWASGVNAAGQLGNGTYDSSDILVQVIGLKKINRIAAHGIGYRSMAIRSDGILWSWGKGYTGDGTTVNRRTPVAVPSFINQIIEKDPIFVEVDGTILQFEQPPIARNNRTLVPLRTIFEALGADVQWNSATSTIKAAKGDISAVLVIGDSIAIVNGKNVVLDTPPTIENNYTLVPVRFISEVFGANVTWEKNNKTIVIKSMQ
ncbi:stalk domain-containing protein [Paenibacillus sp. NEAU-GSW1]|uniref:stalk domain-containing protein n=1 Tax=Paenibacillus sp. NEAU-GSW1 TaxID=2682486 RepID=UPI0012E26AC1|nr:stalk domain-containing protein [Paenibacillus sp. NEAU-GSW1]MUT66845.1 hypothetical protein [Paenibacillus sp. NEAU-GSW1]